MKKVTINILAWTLLIAGLFSFFYIRKITHLFQSKDYYGLELDKPAHPFTMIRSNGNSFSLSELKGNYVYIYFGFTRCYTLCPIRMNQVSQLSSKIDQTNVKFLYITIDPLSDMGESLEKYVNQFSDRVIALRDTEEKVKSIAKKYSISYYKAEDPTQLRHDDFLFLLDKNLNVKLIYPTGYFEVEKMVQDFKYLSEI